MPMAIPSCSPAVPPPPVAGAPKFGLCVRVGLLVTGRRVAGSVVGLTGVAGRDVVAVAPGDVAAGLCVVAEADAVAVAVPVGERLVPGATAGLEVPVPEADGDTEGEKIAGTLDDGEPVHAETVAETRTIKVAQLPTVRCAFMKPP